jgi:sialate O-acetylesterase
MKRIAVLCFAGLMSLITSGNVEAMDKPLLHPLFTDHAVLQRDTKVPVWGWAKQ